VSDVGKMRTIKMRVEENSKQIDLLVDQLVAKYNKDLDELITEFKELLNQAKERESEIGNIELENMTLRLPVLMYFSSGGLESLGIEGDTSKSIKEEAFSRAYMVSSGSTVKDKESEAIISTLSEQMVEIAFSRAYKKLKLQIAQAENIFSGVKKVLSKRMQEIDINLRDTPIQQRRNYNE